MDPTDQTPGRAPAQAKTVRISEDRDGQRLDNFLLGYLKGRRVRSSTRSCARPGARERRSREGRPAAGGRGRGPHPAGAPGRTGRQGHARQGLLEAMEASIVFEDARLLAISKPAGVAAMAAAGSASARSNAAAPCAPNQSLRTRSIASTATPSGLLVIAKKRSALTELQALMRERGRHRQALPSRLLVGRPAQRHDDRRCAAAHRPAPGRRAPSAGESAGQGRR
jgi:23S rRNA pseudouridine955/2504/2580 synthase